jgi:hypothetical protein
VPPVIPQPVVEQLDPFVGQEGADMHSVGDMAHRVFFRLDLWPVLAANIGRHAAVNARNAVVMPGAVQRERRHVEIRSEIAVSQRMQLGHGNIELLAAFAEVAFDHFAGKMIVARRHRRVGGENRVRRDSFERALEVHFLCLHQRTRPLQHQEGGVAFVHVPDRGLDAHGFQRAESAHAQDYFLLDAHLAIAAIKLVGDVAVFGGVFLEVRVQQVEPDMSHAHDPDFYRDHTAGKIDLHFEFLAIISKSRRNRQVVEIGIVVVRHLPPIAVDGLGEIALTVQQADAHEWQPHVGCRLAVVAREDTQAAGIDREAFVKAELGAEIRHHVIVLELLHMITLERLVMVGVVGRQHAVVAGQEDVIFGRFDQTLFIHALEESFRVVARRFPKAWVQPRKQGAGRLVPAVPEIVGQFLQADQPPGKLGVDLDGVCRSLGHIVMPLRRWLFF